jgi:serpin B
VKPPVPSPAASPKAVPAAASAAGRDIVVEAAAPPRPAAPKPAPAMSIFTTPFHDAATAASLADLGLALMRHSTQVSGPGANQVVSPLSVASAMGVVHAGAGGATQQEIGRLLSSAPAGDAGFARRLPSVLARLPGQTGGLTMANRVWVQDGGKPSLQPIFTTLAQERYNADVGFVKFAEPAAAARAINAWVSQKTAARIPTLVSERSLQGNTRAVVTNAVHFKRPWAEPFDAQRTRPMAFRVGADRQSPSKQVPTMVDERTVLTAVVDNLTVYELPFRGGEFSLFIALPPEPHTLQAMVSDASGLDVASWAGAVKPKQCQLQLPKFSLRRASASVKPVLADLGVKLAFGQTADFRPMLGEAGKDIYVSDVVHAATLEIDETGGEGSAATAAVMVSRSAALPPPVCAIDRPFFFVLAHKATGAPVFVGQVQDPTAP